MLHVNSRFLPMRTGHWPRITSFGEGPFQSLAFDGGNGSFLLGSTILIAMIWNCGGLRFGMVRMMLPPLGITASDNFFAPSGSNAFVPSCPQLMGLLITPFPPTLTHFSHTLFDWKNTCRFVSDDSLTTWTVLDPCCLMSIPAPPPLPPYHEPVQILQLDWLSLHHL